MISSLQKQLEEQQMEIGQLCEVVALEKDERLMSRPDSSKQWSG